jgi:hypothetical protein
MIDLFRYKFGSNISCPPDAKTGFSNPGLVFQRSNNYFLDVISNTGNVYPLWRDLSESDGLLADELGVNAKSFKPDPVNARFRVWIFRNEVIKCKHEHRHDDRIWSHTESNSYSTGSVSGSVNYMSGFYGFGVKSNGFSVSLFSKKDEIQIGLNESIERSASRIEELALKIELETFYCQGAYPYLLNSMPSYYLSGRVTGGISGNDFSQFLTDQEIRENFSNSSERSIVFNSTKVSP